MDAFELVGEVVREQYRVEAVAGEGGFGVVYRAHHLGFDEPVALKCLRMPEGLPAEARAAFVNTFKVEARTLFRLSQHPAIVRVLETGILPSAGGEVPFLVLEWLDGHDLAHELARRAARGARPFSPHEAVELLRPAMEGLASAHRLGFAHRDVKPANLFLCETALGRTVKVLDFGIAKVMEEGETAARAITRSDAAIRPFSPGHAAPEQVSAPQFGATGPWTDVHALALVLVELVSGRRALEGRQLAEWLTSATRPERPTPRARGATVSDAFERECARALSLRSADRHSDARALLQALDQALAEPTPAYPAPPPSPRSPYRDPGTQPLPAAVGSTEPLPADYRPPEVPPRAASVSDEVELDHLVGREVAGFTLTSLLGEGGMAVVFCGENVMNRGIARAIKIVRPELASREEFAARFADEALTLERLSHPNIVRFYGLRTHVQGQRRLLVMELELLAGEVLSRVVRKRGEGASIDDGVRWMAMAARGVAAAHARQVVHRDLKPENLFLTEDGVVKVLDFGIAKAVDDADRASRRTREGVMPGSPPYMAPEICRGGVPDVRADVYALGITLLEVLLGHHPFAPPGEPFRSSTQMMFAHVNEKLPALRSKRRDAPAELERIVERATAKDPDERYAHAGELASALEALGTSGVEAPRKLDVSTQFAVPVSVEPKPHSVAPAAAVATTKKRGVLVFGLLGGLALLAAAGAAIGGGLGGGEEPERDSRVLAEAPAEAPEPSPAVDNRWVRIAAPARHVLVGIEGDAESDRGFRHSRGIEAPRVDFEIQQHEVTWGELDPWLAEHLDAMFARPTFVPGDPAHRRHHAASGVPWEVGRRYCQSIGGNLPREEEWALAARGAEMRPLPWGASPIDLIRTHVFAGPDGHPGEVMTHDQDRTPGTEGEAIWDLLGNALEWTVDVYRDDLPDQDESWTQADGLSFRAVRGLSPRGTLPRGLQREGAAYRDALCATGSCPASTARILELVGFRCVRRVGE